MSKPGTPDGDRLDVLVTLVEAYEAKHWWIDPPDPIEATKLRMQQRGLSRRDLEKVLGGKSRGSATPKEKGNRSYKSLVGWATRRLCPTSPLVVSKRESPPWLIEWIH